MSTWYLYIDGPVVEERGGWAVTPPSGEGGYSVKLLRDIHRALLALSPEDYAEVRKMLEGEEELHE